MKLQKRAIESVLNIIGSMQGTAWKLLESFDVTKLDEEKSFDMVIVLDSAFQYDARVGLPVDFDNYFGLSRKPGTTLLSYVTDHDEKYRKVNEHGVKLPDQLQGWLLLRRANITKEQYQLVLSQAPKLEKLSVQEALFVILGQDYKAAVTHDRHDRRPQLPGRFFRNKAYAADDETYDEDLDREEDGYYEYDPDTYDQSEALDESWTEDQFDSQAAYYEDDYTGDNDTAFEELDVDTYDEAYAAYLDARRRFQDLKLSRGFLPVVALDQSSMGSSPTSSPPAPGRGKGKGGKPKGRKGKGSNTVRYPPRGKGKAPDPKGRASAILHCLRCGATGHQAANCPRPPKHASSSPSSSPKKQHTEGMAAVMLPGESGLVTFEDQDGRPRVDCTMLDPGASAFLMGSGPLHRYLEHLEQLGFPMELIQLRRTSRTFHFGGDHSTTSHWIARVPMFVNNTFGFCQSFIIKGETPMLMGRPVIEALGIIINFKNQQMMFDGHPWRPVTLGRHGEYLLSLTEDVETELADQTPSFDLRLAEEQPDQQLSDDVVDLITYKKEEGIFNASEDNPAASGQKPVLNKHWKMFETALSTELNRAHALVTQELHQPQPRPRIIWEIYAGASRTSQIAEALGCETRVFGYETDWDFDIASHRRALLDMIDDEMPDEIFLAPRCGLWSRMQAINAKTPERKELLQQQRQLHHDCHLQFCRKIYLKQVHGGRQAHLEQPHGALSWQTKALRSLPGLYTVFDQCRYGACCLDDDGTWKLVRKATGIKTTKKAMAQSLNLRCDGKHPHCQLEGQFPGSGRSKTSYMEDYQPAMASALASTMASPEVPNHWEDVNAVEEVKAVQGKLVQLMTDNQAEATRTVQRLHRNLGHPSPLALVEMLESRGASEAVLNVARNFQCHSCLRYRKPNQVAPASSKVILKFNQNVQADVFWLKSGSNKIPILSMVDEGTRFQAASVVNGEKAEDFITALERCWLSHFGPMQQLITDEGRGWLHQDFEAWTENHSIHHVVAAGEAHQQIALVERRHAVLRKALEIYLADFGLTGSNAIRQALCYVVPQLNNTPSTSGFSPAQWVLGQSPEFPGELLSTNLTPVHLGESFEDELTRRATARMAIVQADVDQKLRRALLRKYAGTNQVLNPGQKCFFWRDARAPDLIKIRWKGPATVLMKEEDEDGRVKVYWLGYKTQLLRAAPHHVRPEIGQTMDSLRGTLDDAKTVIHQLKSRGVTRYSDLTVLNKRNIQDVDTDEEIMDDLDSGAAEPPTTRRRLVDPEVMSPDSIIYSPSVLPDDAEADLGIGLEDQPPAEEQPSLLQPLAPIGFPEHPPTGLLEQHLQGQPPEPTIAVPDTPDAEVTSGEPSREPSPMHSEAPQGLPHTQLDYLPPDSSTTPTPPTTTSPSQLPPTQSPQPPQLDPFTASLYQPATDEDFRAHRLRFEQQETMSFGPFRRRREAAQQGQPTAHGTSPYPTSSATEAKETPADPDSSLSAFDIDDIEVTALPPGWKLEQGYITLDDKVKDYWELKAGCLIRHHAIPRRAAFDPRALSARDLEHMPVPLSRLDPVRVTVRKDNDLIQHTTDHISDGHYTLSKKPWTGCTIFQLNGDTRKELGCHAYSAMTAKQLGKKQKTHAQRQERRSTAKSNLPKSEINEKKLSLEDRLLFHQAKVKELKSFFDNGVWSFQTTKEADPGRTMTSRILLKWSKNPDGTPRAKARLVVRGFQDADALAGQLDTASPASTRLGRSVLLSISACLNWCGWSADVSTAFLQGLPPKKDFYGSDFLLMPTGFLEGMKPPGCFFTSPSTDS